MCLTLKFATEKQAEKARSKPKVTKKDRVVWKILLRTDHPDLFLSPFRKFRWQKGFHYYQTDEKFGTRIHHNKSNMWDVDYYALTVNEGLHAFTSKYEAQNRVFLPLHAVVEMVIPKGSEYYESKRHNEIVTDNLIFN